MKHRSRGTFQRLRSDSGQYRRILAVLVVLGMVSFLPPIGQLYSLMVVHYDTYAQLALRNQTRTTPVTGERGVIYDRNMNVLAYSQTVWNLYLDPQELKQSRADLEELSRVLGEILDRKPDWILEQAKDLKKRYKQLAADVDSAVAGAVLQYIDEKSVSGVHLEPSSRRNYPYGTLASQVIGFTNRSNDGCEGIEAAYDRFLAGTPGKVITTKGSNEMDMPFSFEKYLASVQGDSLILTLDATVQQCLENQLNAAIRRYDVQNGAFGLVMNVKTGEILAMATLGGYDPNAYLEIADPDVAAQVEQLRRDYLQFPEDSGEYKDGWERYKQAVSDARLKQWRNRVIADGYEPGSTFKTITMAAALETGAIDLNTTFHCGGSEQIPGRSQRLHCWRAAGHGSETTAQALQNSCNIAFAHIALKLGGERFYEYMEKFGVMEKTGIDLAGESKGVYFDKSLIVNTEKWGTASLTSGSFGQTFKVTPMQLVRSIAAVVNGGYLLEPYIVSEAVDASGKTTLKQEPTVLRQVISNETSATMCKLMESVVSEGTAKNAQVAGFSIGGKTGTSEKIDVFDENGQRVLDKIVSFVGVAPMDDPEYIVLAALDTPSRETGLYISGGVMAAPTVGAILSDILPYLGVSRSYPEGDPRGTTVEVADYAGMTAKDAAKQAETQTLTPRLVGDGETVTAQIPAPGQNVAGASQVLLYLGQPLPNEQVTVPDFYGKNQQQAGDLAASLGLRVEIAGNDTVAQQVTVSMQSLTPGETVPRGTVITLTFTDTRASD